MQQAHRPRVEVAAAAKNIVAAEAVLVPPVLDRRHVEHHDPRVEVARPPPGERPREPLLRPEPGREVLGEVGVAVLGRADGAAAEVGAPELGDVVDEDEVGVEVDDAAHAGLEEVGEVVARVVEGLLQSLPHRRGDEPSDAVGVEVVDLEPELREHGADEVPEARVGDEEVEEDALRAPGVLHHRVDRRDGAPEVLLIERNRDVDEGGVADIGGGAVARSAVGGIAEGRGAAEGDPPGAPRDLAREADAAVELGGPDGLGGREGLERRRQDHHHHGGGEEAGHARHPQHRAPPAGATASSRRLARVAAAAAASTAPKTPSRRAMDGVLGWTGWNTPASRTSIGSRRALLAGGGGSARGVVRKRAGIHARPGEVNGGTEQSSRMRRPEAAPTNPPRHAGRRFPPLVSSPSFPSPGHRSAFLPLGALACVTVAAAAVPLPAAAGGCLLYPPLRFCLILRCNFGDLRFIPRPLALFFLYTFEKGAGERSGEETRGRKAAGLAQLGWAAAEEDGEPGILSFPHHLLPDFRGCLLIVASCLSVTKNRICMIFLWFEMLCPLIQYPFFCLNLCSFSSYRGN
ncbi:hypothetical protein HU200_044798 [Digitaria exilis]|uniref:Uncharacterized protein n=1 Tax=Digitaria exilis TaxID=1010633 RepID=A0A835B1J6_9POAL|nr:hypothetical protein HU200_044798 [Digitaria exilis]